MAIHSSILAGKIPRTKKLGGLHSPWGRRVRHSEVHTRIYCTALGIQPILYNISKCNIIYKKCKALCCTLETNNVNQLYLNFLKKVLYVYTEREM